MPDPATITPIRSTKGVLAIAIVFVYIGAWAFAIYSTITDADLTSGDRMEFLLQFAGATGVMGMIVLIVVQNFFRKTEAQ